MKMEILSDKRRDLHWLAVVETRGGKESSKNRGERERESYYVSLCEKVLIVVLATQTPGPAPAAAPARTRPSVLSSSLVLSCPVARCRYSIASDNVLDV